MKEGIITKLISGFYDVYSEGTTYVCRASGSLRDNKEKPLIGDSVMFDVIDESTGFIKKILPRSNELVRPPVANINYALVVFSAIEPSINYGLLDRILLMCISNNIKPIIIITKLDLLSTQDKEELLETLKYYENVTHVLYKNDDIYNQIKDIIGSNIAFVIGQSGVGKSTLLNGIDSNLNIAVNEISAKLGRGKHTTRHSEVYVVKDLRIADTPGFSTMELAIKEKEDIKDNYPDFLALSDQCKFNGCTHIHEPGCKVIEEFNNGNILKSRYENYQHFFEEIKNVKKY